MFNLWEVIRPEFIRDNDVTITIHNHEGSLIWDHSLEELMQGCRCVKMMLRCEDGDYILDIW